MILAVHMFFLHNNHHTRYLYCNNERLALLKAKHGWRMGEQRSYQILLWIRRMERRLHLINNCEREMCINFAQLYLMQRIKYEQSMRK